MYSEEEILKSAEIQQIIRAKCENSLQYFTRFFFYFQNRKRKYNLYDFNIDILDTLESTYSGNNTRLIINMPPRYGKTEMLKSYIALGLALNPESRYLYTSASDSLVADVSMAVKDIVTSPIFNALWGIELRKDTNSKQKWYTDKGGGFYAPPFQGQITGFGAGTVADYPEKELNDYLSDINNFGGALLMDDIIKPDDARFYPKKRDNVNTKLVTTISNRINSSHTPMILIMHRLHPNDPAGFLADNRVEGDWTVKKYAAIKDDGTPLNPNRHTIDELMNKKLIDEEDFQSQYMQNPIAAKGLSFPFNELNYFENLPDEKPFHIYSFSDYADTGNDYYSMPIGYIYLNPLRVYIADVVFSLDGTAYTLPETVSKIISHKIDKAAIETNAEGIFGFKEVKRNTENLPVEILGIRAKANKESRIAQQRDFIKSKFYFKSKRLQPFGSEYYKYFNQLTEHKKAGGNSNDDAPDSTAGLAAMIRSFIEK